MFCPADIEFLLWSHSHPGPINNVTSDTNQRAIGRLKATGLIEYETGTTYRTTKKGAAYVEHICNTPLPQQEWGPGRRSGD